MFVAYHAFLEKRDTPVGISLLARDTIEAMRRDDMLRCVMERASSVYLWLLLPERRDDHVWAERTSLDVLPPNAAEFFLRRAMLEGTRENLRRYEINKMLSYVVGRKDLPMMRTLIRRKFVTFRDMMGTAINYSRKESSVMRTVYRECQGHKCDIRDLEFLLDENLSVNAPNPASYQLTRWLRTRAPMDKKTNEQAHARIELITLTAAQKYLEREKGFVAKLLENKIAGLRIHMRKVEMDKGIEVLPRAYSDM